MEREIKFRARRLSDGKWCTGDLAVGKDAAYIISGWPLETEKLSMLMGTYSLRVEGQINVCDLKTVGQCTNLKDKNSKEIYEGDIVDVWSAGSHATNGVITWGQGSAGFFIKIGAPIVIWNLSGDSDGTDNLEIIGNIYENPELLNSNNSEAAA